VYFQEQASVARRRNSTDPQLSLPLAAKAGGERVLVVERDPATALARKAEARPLAEKRVSRARVLEETLRARLGPLTRVLITDTRTVLASQSVRAGVRTVRLHQMFLDAPDPVRQALAQYLESGDRRAGRVVDGFIEAKDHLLALHAEPLAPDAHQGEHHDLRELFAALNHEYFEAAIEADLTWGIGGSFRGPSRTSITLGTYDYRAKRITIHPVLDQAEVPRRCVARIVHHEMCHARHPAQESAGGRRLVHTSAFRREEARFEGAHQADAWLDANLDAILRYRAQRTSPHRGHSRR
jgi:hypothetical protein